MAYLLDANVFIEAKNTNNQQLPVALYEEIQLGSASGLNELFQCSRLGVGKGLQETVVKIAKISDERKGV